LKINEPKTSILYFAYIQKFALFILKNDRECVAITDTGQYWQQMLTGYPVIISFLLTTREAHMTAHNRAFQIVT